MEHFSELSDTLARITTARSPSALWPSVKDFAARFGYSHLVALDADLVSDNLDGAFLYSDAPRHLREALVQERIFEGHPFVLRARISPAPFMVSELRDDPRHAGQRWTELLAPVVKNGDGLVVPVYRANSLCAGFNFGGDKPDTSAVVRSMLQVVAHAAIQRTKNLRNGDVAHGAPPLTAREVQCLREVAIGRGDAEIGRILGISPRTVRFHVDSAKTKLGVTTRIQAVAKALREKVIAV